VVSDSADPLHIPKPCKGAVRTQGVCRHHNLSPS
jgi:hypothetical protein